MKQSSGMVSRVMTAYKVNDSADLAPILKVNKSTVRGWKHRGNVSRSALLQTSHDTGYCYEWLRTGEGGMFSSDQLQIVSEETGENSSGPIKIDQASLHHLKHINRLLEILTSGTRAAEKVISDLDERYEQMELELRLEKLEDQQKPATGTETSGR